MPTIGIDIGGTEIKAGLVAGDGRILESARTASDRHDLDALIASVVELVESVARPEDPTAIGVGVPGLVSPRSGTVRFAPNMPALNGVAVGPVLSERTGRSVVVGNDADLNAWGEFAAGAGMGTTHMVCLTVGTGLGSGVILEQRLYTGSTGYGAEAGHIVIDPGGRPCGCGGRGCLETVASATGIVNLAREGMSGGGRTVLCDGDRLTAKGILDAARAGDDLAVSVYAEAGRWLGLACATLINLLGPQMIVIGGGVAAAGSLLMEPAIAEARSRAYPQLFESCQILPARLGSEAGVVGAALFARSEVS